MRIHEYLEIAPAEGGRPVIRCLRCHHVFCGADENYKGYARLRERLPSQVAAQTWPDRQPPFITFQEFICPGCGTLLEVDSYCPELDREEPLLWDIRVNAESGNEPNSPTLAGNPPAPAVRPHALRPTSEEREGGVDPVRYEVFRHRLFHILEEGRLAMKRVSGSPVVVEGGETMCSFYTAGGTPILTAAGILLHCTGARDFILKAIEWYQDDPGFQEGDQLFFNDPYIGGQHLPDQIILKPIFYRGQRIAWTGSFMHTPETGGIEPGGMPTRSTEIFQEGIRILGLKIVEKGRFRPEVFRTIVQQTRDPHLVGLDIKARIAANNVCARRYLELVERFGLAFVEAAGCQIIQDSEKMARARLRALPDGTWRSRLYGDATGIEERPFRVVCTMTKMGEELTFDFTGTSPQNPGSFNCTLSASWGQLFVVLGSQLFWDVPWNGGMIAPVRLVIPEGTVLNCKFPAACSNAILPGIMLYTAAHQCVARMLYAAGLQQDVNAGWASTAMAPYFGGINQFGHPFAGALLDAFAGGLGATPARDGVDTGGLMVNPTSNISDVEILEMNLPFLYLTRRQCRDSAGFGRFQGGLGLESILMVHGTRELMLGCIGNGRRVTPNFGLCGGYPPGFVEARLVQDPQVARWFRESRSPQGFQDLTAVGGQVQEMPVSFPVRPLREGDLLYFRMGAGGGYGDLLERGPRLVLRDLRRGAISWTTAQEVYGLVLDPAGQEPDLAETERRRQEMRAERIGSAGRCQQRP